MPNLVPPGPAGGGQPVQPVHHVRYRPDRRDRVQPALPGQPGARRPVALLHHQPGEPGAVLQHGDVRGVRSDHLCAAGDPQAAVQRAYLGTVGGQGHLGGLEVHRPDRRWCAGWSSGWSGAFAAGGVVVGLGQPYITHTLHGGNAGWGVVFAAIFVGLAGGMFLGLRILNGFSRRRLFGLSIASAAIPLALIALIPNLVVTVVLVVVLGACAGVAYVTGYTIVGLEVDDDTRGRTFAFLSSAIRVILFAVIAVSPFVAAGFTALIRGVSGAGSLRIGHVSYEGHRLQLRDAAGRGDRGVARRGLLPAHGRPQGRAAARRPGVRGPGRGVPAGARSRQRLRQRQRGGSRPARRVHRAGGR